MKDLIHTLLLAMLLAVTVTIKQENTMRAKQAQCRSTTMAKAMNTPEYQTPPDDQILLEAPNTVKQRTARDTFYRLAGQAQGLHVRF